MFIFIFFGFLVLECKILAIHVFYQRYIRPNNPWMVSKIAYLTCAILRGQSRSDIKDEKIHTMHLEVPVVAHVIRDSYPCLFVADKFGCTADNLTKIPHPLI